MKKLLSVVLSLLLLFPCFSSAYASTLIEILDDLDYESILYVKQKVDERYEELKKQKEQEESSIQIEWVKKFFVDDFGDPTDSPYIENKKYIKGTFSNSVTKNSFLNVTLLFANRPAIFLYEYGNSQVTSYGTEYYKILIKEEDGTTTQLTGEMSSGGDRIIIYDKEMINTFLQIMKNPQVIKMYLEEQSYSMNSYLFSVNTEGFAEIYQEVFGE